MLCITVDSASACVGSTFDRMETPYTLCRSTLGRIDSVERLTSNQINLNQGPTRFKLGVNRP